ncbi:MAG TPA: hypothetical protein VGL77_13715 [Armatimonadota bacterium]|jgi:hypothetical protein
MYGNTIMTILPNAGVPGIEGLYAIAGKVGTYNTLQQIGGTYYLYPSDETCESVWISETLGDTANGYKLAEPWMGWGGNYVGQGTRAGHTLTVLDYPLFDRYDVTATDPSYERFTGAYTRQNGLQNDLPYFASASGKILVANAGGAPWELRDVVGTTIGLQDGGCGDARLVSPATTYVDTSTYNPVATAVYNLGLDAEDYPALTQSLCYPTLYLEQASHLEQQVLDLGAAGVTQVKHALASGENWVTVSWRATPEVDIPLDVPSDWNIMGRIMPLALGANTPSRPIPTLRIYGAGDALLAELSPPQYGSSTLRGYDAGEHGSAPLYYEPRLTRTPVGFIGGHPGSVTFPSHPTCDFDVSSLPLITITKVELTCGYGVNQVPYIDAESTFISGGHGIIVVLHHRSANSLGATVAAITSAPTSSYQVASQAVYDQSCATEMVNGAAPPTCVIESHSIAGQTLTITPVATAGEGNSITDITATWGSTAHWADGLGLSAWYSAGAGVTVDGDGKVQAWAPKVGNAVFIPHDDARFAAPTLGAASGLNGKPAVIFAGAQALKNTAGWGVNLSDPATDHTVIMVRTIINPMSPPQPERVLLSCPGIIIHGQWYHTCNSTSGDEYCEVAYTENNAQLALTNQANTVKQMVNAIPMVTDGTPTRWLNAAGPLELGVDVQNFNDQDTYPPAVMQLAELIIFNRALTANEISTVYARFAFEYGLQGGGIYEDTTAGCENGDPVSWDYPAAGTYGVYCTATDSTGAKAVSDILQVVIDSNDIPSCSFTVTVGEDGRTVTINANASFDPDGTIASWRYNPGDGSGWWPGIVGIPSVYEYLARSPVGGFLLTVEVTDNGGATDTQSALIETSYDITLTPEVVVSQNGEDVTVVVTPNMVTDDPDAVPVVSFVSDDNAHEVTMTDGTSVTYTRAAWVAFSRVMRVEIAVRSGAWQSGILWADTALDDTKFRLLRGTFSALCANRVGLSYGMPAYLRDVGALVVGGEDNAAEFVTPYIGPVDPLTVESTCPIRCALWVDTSVSPPVFRVRNGTNTGWE